MEIEEMATSGFDGLLDAVLRDAVNPSVPAGIKERVMARVAEESMHGSAEREVLRFPGLGAGFGREIGRAGWKGGRGSGVTAFALHVAAVLLIALLVRQQVRFAAPERAAMMTELMTPVPARVLSRAMAGGGGQRGPAPVSRGHLPRLAEQQVVAPSVRAIEQPKLAVEPTIVVQRDLTMASKLPDVGAPNSPVVGMSMGNGAGTGLGSGYGAGLGPGSGGNAGGGVYHIGGGVSAPVLVYQVEPEFSEQARKAKVSGNVVVNLWVDAEGRPSHIRVIRGVGMGLDERAAAAVEQYRFKPAMAGGRAVAVEMNIEVDFQIF